jgi:hypothetical protein
MVSSQAQAQAQAQVAVGLTLTSPAFRKASGIARRTVGRLRPHHGTAIGGWLRLARELFATREDTLRKISAALLHRLHSRRIRGYQIRARVGDTRITYG